MKIGDVDKERDKLLLAVDLTLEAVGLPELYAIATKARSNADGVVSKGLALREQADTELGKAEEILVKEVKKAETAFGKVVKVAQKAFEPVKKEAIRKHEDANLHILVANKVYAALEAIGFIKIE